MLILRAFNVTSDGKWLTVDIAANEGLAGVYIKSLRLSCTGAFSSTDTSATLFDTLIEEAINEYTGEVIDWEDCPTEIRIRIDVSGMNKPFYLLAVAEDPEESATTCAYHNPITAVTFNKYPLYKAIACAAHEFAGCTPPQHFMDYLMQLKALEASIAVGDYDSINAYYEWLILHGSTGYTCGEAASSHHQNHGCGCHH